MGRVDHDELLHYYEISDLFVFPSTTDTFGMVILEAHSKGLPALVTDVGGPQEIIKDKETGFVLKISDRASWAEKILEIHNMKINAPNEFAMMRAKCQQRISEKYSWDDALNDILGDETLPEEKEYTHTLPLAGQIPVHQKGAA